MHKQNPPYFVMKYGGFFYALVIEKLIALIGILFYNKKKNLRKGMRKADRKREDG